MKPFVEKLKQLPEHVSIFIPFGIGVGIVAFTALFFFLPKDTTTPYRIDSFAGPRDDIAPQYVDDFYVSYVAPNKLFTDSKQPISFYFSQPAEAHHLEEFFTIRPAIEGMFEQGGTPTEIRFVPKVPYMEGVTYEITISNGFYSTSNKKMRDDYLTTFALGYDSDTFRLTNHGDASYLFGVADEHTLTFQVGNFQDKTSLKISSITDPAKLFESFNESNFGYNYYKNPSSPSKSISNALTLVSEKASIKTGDQLELPAGPGIYLVELYNQGNLKGWSWVVKSSYGAHFRQDDQGFLLGLQNLVTGAPLTETATVDIYSNGNKLKTVKAKNLEHIPLEYPTTISALAITINGEVLIVPVNLYGSMAEINIWRNLKQTMQVFAYKDKPLYHPGDTLHFRGLIRQDNDSIYSVPPAGRTIDVDFGNSRVVTVKTGKRGEFYGEWKIPETETPGVGSAMIRVQDVYTGSFTYEVANYVKPPFDLTLATDKDEVTKGDKITLSLGGYRFDGKPFQNQKVTVRAYTLDYYETEKAVYSKSFKLNSWGGMCGGGSDEPYYGDLLFEDTNVTIGADGKATFVYDTKKLDKKLSQNITFMIEKTDDRGNTITTGKSTIVHAGDLNIFVRSPKAATIQALPSKFFFTAEYQNGGKAANQMFDYALDAVGYANEIVESNLKKGTVVTGNDGIGEVALPDDITLPEGYDRFRIRVSKTDNKGNLVTGELTVYNYAEKETILKVISEKNNLILGTAATMLVEAPEDMTVLLAYERGRLYDPVFLNLKKGENRIRFSVDDEYMPSITPTFSFFYHGKYYVEGLSFNVPAMSKLLTVDVKSDKPQYVSGDKATMTIRLTDSNGKPVKGEFSLGIVDKAVYALRKGSIPAMHSSFYFYRSRTTNNSSSMTYITLGTGAERGGGGGGGTPSPGLNESDLLYWNPLIETNENGEAVVNFPITGNTIYKAVIFAATDRTELGQSEFDLTVR